ncbi:MAG: hypothetical protein GY749_36665 [Desulfobacteraceae bacterium]|nr:hypothetical protein [Desulfobacteraceae bacterium]
MRILLLKYNDQSRHWQLNPMTFNRVTLLVGASGAGKTQILNSIMNLKKIASGDSINGLKWEMKFSTVTGNIYVWEGEFDNKFSDEKFFPETIDEKDAPAIVYEKLYLNDSLIVERDQGKIIFNGKKTVKLPREKSAINLLKEEEQIAVVYYGFEKIILHDRLELKISEFPHRDIQTDQCEKIEDIQESCFSAKISFRHSFETENSLTN